MRVILIIGVLALVSACSGFVKTPVVADYSNLDLIGSDTKKNDISILLGSPQGIGLYGPRDALNELQFYFGLAGKISSSGADADSGTAFISFNKEQPVDVLYYKSKMTGREIKYAKGLDIAKLANFLRIGSSSIDDLVKEAGVPSFEGRRLNFLDKIEHKIYVWDASQAQQNGSIIEKSLLVGFDNNRIIQDVSWMSSKPEDIMALGQISEQQLKQMFRNLPAGFLPMVESTAFDFGNRVDPVQVNGLLASNAKHIDDFIKVLGKPSALGVRSFLGGSAMRLSNWSFSRIEMKGTEGNFIPSGTSEEYRVKLRAQESLYYVMNVQQYRLTIGHSQDGEVKDVLWTYPVGK